MGLVPIVDLAEDIFTVDGADFDGTNDYMLRGGDLTGISDGKVGTISVWFRRDSVPGSFMYVFSGWTNPVPYLVAGLSTNTNSHTFVVTGRNTTPTVILDLQSNTSFSSTGTWHHFLASWDLGNSLGHVYVDGSEDLRAGAVITNDTINYTNTEWAFGATNSGTVKYNGCLAEVWFTNEYLDITNAANRAKFIDTSGKPVYLGVAGARPTGSTPLVYQRVANNAAASTFATNLGSGGNFTITGSLDVSSDSPSD